MKTFIQFISEDVSKWKQSWVKEDSDRKIGSEYPPHEILEYVTSFHDQEDFDDTDFYERITKYDKFILKSIDINDLDLEEYTLNDEKVDQYVEDYKNQDGEYPFIVIEDDYSIIDGLHRANALDRLGKKEVKAYVGDGSPEI